MIFRLEIENTRLRMESKSTDSIPNTNFMGRKVGTDRGTGGHFKDIADSKRIFKKRLHKKTIRVEVAREQARLIIFMENKRGVQIH